MCGRWIPALWVHTTHTGGHCRRHGVNQRDQRRFLLCITQTLSIMRFPAPTGQALGPHVHARIHAHGLQQCLVFYLHCLSALVEVEEIIGAFLFILLYWKVESRETKVLTFFHILSPGGGIKAREGILTTSQNHYNQRPHHGPQIPEQLLRIQEDDCCTDPFPGRLNI